MNRQSVKIQSNPVWIYKWQTQRVKNLLKTAQPKWLSYKCVCECDLSWGLHKLADLKSRDLEVHMVEEQQGRETRACSFTVSESWWVCLKCRVAVEQWCNGCWEGRHDEHDRGARMAENGEESEILIPGVWNVLQKLDMLGLQELNNPKDTLWITKKWEIQRNCFCISKRDWQSEWLHSSQVRLGQYRWN